MSWFRVASRVGWLVHSPRRIFAIPLSRRSVMSSQRSLASAARVIPIAVLCLAACSHSAGRSIAAPAQREMDVYLLAGQSNMAGRGVVEAQDRVPEPARADARSPMTWVPAVDPVHYDKPIAGVGPGRSSRSRWRARDVDARIGLVPAAVGGSPISSWEPGALDPATNTHPYDDAIARARVAIRDGRLAGFSGIRENRTRRRNCRCATRRSFAH